METYNPVRPIERSASECLRAFYLVHREEVRLSAALFALCAALTACAMAIVF